MKGRSNQRTKESGNISFLYYHQIESKSSRHFFCSSFGHTFGSSIHVILSTLLPASSLYCTLWWISFLSHWRYLLSGEKEVGNLLLFASVLWMFFFFSKLEWLSWIGSFIERREKSHEKIDRNPRRQHLFLLITRIFPLSLFPGSLDQEGTQLWEANEVFVRIHFQSSETFYFYSFSSILLSHFPLFKLCYLHVIEF